MVQITKHHMEKFYKQLTFGNSSQRKENLGENKMEKTKNEKLEQFLNDGNFIYLDYYSEQEMVVTNGNISFLENEKEFQSVRVMNKFMNELFYSDKYEKNMSIEKAEQFVLSIMEDEDKYLELINS